MRLENRVFEVCLWLQAHLGAATQSLTQCTPQAPHFRKLHLELAMQGSGVQARISTRSVWISSLALADSCLQVLHCVMFPRTQLALPILAFDMVASGANVPSLCIVDLCPVSDDLSLPAELEATAR